MKMEPVNAHGWELKSIRELIDDFERGISYSSEDIATPDAIPMMNLACVDKSGFYRPNRLKFYSGSYTESQKVFPNDMLIACTDMTREAEIIGTPILVPDDADFLLYTMDLALFKPKEGVCPMFLYYALKTKYYRKYIKPWASGTNVLHLNLKGVYDYKLYLPRKYTEQKVIVKVLASIDRKIELNKAINANLEAMAKQLYDYWFVQFDFPDSNGRPYKSSGGKMLYNPKLKRDIPEGWEAGVLSDIANITMGQSPDGESYNEEGKGIIFYQGSTDFGVRFPKIRQYTTAPSRFASKGDILMSVRAPVGAINIANNDCCIGRGLSAINSRIGSITHLYYVLDWLRVYFERQNAAGTTFGSINKDELHGLEVVIPQKATLSAFESICSPIFDLQMKIGEDINRLTALRDSLLPMLMNGQVSVL